MAQPMASPRTLPPQGDPVIRRATSSDFAAIRETIAASMSAAYRPFMPPLERAGYLRHWCTPERYARELADPRQRHCVAVLDGRIVGIASAADQGDRAELWRMYVRPDAWRHGVGRRLWNEIASWARAQGLRRIRLESFADAPASQRFYQAMGCVPGHVWTAILVEGSRFTVHLREFIAVL